MSHKKISIRGVFVIITFSLAKELSDMLRLFVESLSTLASHKHGISRGEIDCGKKKTAECIMIQEIMVCLLS